MTSQFTALVPTKPADDAGSVATALIEIHLIRGGSEFPATEVGSAKGAVTFRGGNWEEELVWAAVQLLRNQFRAGRDEMKNALAAALQRI